MSIKISETDEVLQNEVIEVVMTLHEAIIASNRMKTVSMAALIAGLEILTEEYKDKYARVNDPSLN